MARILSILTLVTLALLVTSAAAANPFEERHTRVALSVERFMGIDYTNFEGPDEPSVRARFLLNASEVVPTQHARAGFDVFIKRFSIGLGGGVTTNEVGIIAPRFGVAFGFSSAVGLWLRGGMFFASAPSASYIGFNADVLLVFFPSRTLALHLGPSLDLAFAVDDRRDRRDYASFGFLQVGSTVFL